MYCNFSGNNFEEVIRNQRTIRRSADTRFETNEDTSMQKTKNNVIVIIIGISPMTNKINFLIIIVLKVVSVEKN